MLYKIRNTILPTKSFISGADIGQIINDTLVMHEKGDGLLESPFIKAGEWKHHLKCWNAGNTIESAYERQDDIIALYKDIKANGYNGSAILGWFDDYGNINTYDGFHRLAIMKHLNMDVLVNVETEWKGVDGAVGRDFPLIETLRKTHHRGDLLYQPVDDIRLKGWKIAREDTVRRGDYIMNTLTGNTVLILGCSEGYFARRIASKGYKVVAIDKDPNLTHIANYLSIIEGFGHEIEYKCSDWREVLKEDKNYDNILFLSVIHNDMKIKGVDECLKDLELFKNKTTQLYLEVPNNTNEREWMKPGFPTYDFHANIKNVADIVGLSCHSNGDLPKSVHKLARTTYILSTTPVTEKSKDEKIELSELDNWINRPGGDHYKPLFTTLKTGHYHNIMEIGVFNGDNGAMMIKAASKNVPEEEITYYGFDLFEDKTPVKCGEEFAGGFGKPISMQTTYDNIIAKTKAKVVLTKGDSRQTLKAKIGSKAGLPIMDLIYIDGGHSIATTRSDWKQASKLMDKNTIVYFDDYCDEIPFIGSAFIPKELTPKYTYSVMTAVNKYPRAFGHLKSQLLKVQLKNIELMKRSPHFRFHLLGLPHSKTTKDWILCAFTQLAYRMSTMMMNLGHEVYHYGTEGSDVPCTEHIDVLSEKTQKEAYGDWDARTQLWIHNGGDLAYTTFRKNAIREINARAQHKDMLLVSVGTWQKEVADKVDIPAIEYCVGYLGYFSKYKVFPSYAWMHHLYGRAGKRGDGVMPKNFSTPSFYDVVIPHYFDINDFEFNDKKGDYFLYLGRLIERKGVNIAAELTKKIGAKLIVSGQPMYPDEPRKTQSMANLGLIQPHIEYVGTADIKTRSDLMKNAKAVIMPSRYFEPFGLVAVESLLCGTPLITTDWGSFPEIVKQGEVGFRCRTFDDFVWAAENIHKISPARCREYAVANYSMERIALSYQEYFTKIYDLFGKGWYAEHPERKNLDWLKKY